ncbi:recombinase family protein [Marinococcus halophilus]|uniref:Serine recombinase n=1 Tax=Marinococcus halophilus TaxID=1371 RepID=A0A510Y1P3_MARHA|nr:recombinase family protein [Marinococcus halophilus]GEK57103.1 serine recombinase [Marinococcus halophilus]
MQYENNAILDVQSVAVYLRKSRNEEGETDVLQKHRNQLLDFVQSYGWKFDLFQEIGSSDDLEFRTEFKRLLERVQAGIYDAVVVVEFDRLTRGDSYDYGYIKRIFAESRTKILTPYGEIIDLSDEFNVMNDMKATMGRYEYLQTKKRLNEGKLRSARLGNWVNGTPPLGYDYDHKTKKLVINEDEAKAVRMIFYLYHEKGNSMDNTSFEMNRLGFKTKRNDYFTVTKIGRILQNQTYVGRIVYGKSEGSGHKHKKSKTLRYKPENEWLVVVDDAHPALISKDVYEQIQIQMTKKRRIPPKARYSGYALTGLMRCNRCNSIMNFTKKQLVKAGWKCYVRTCVTPDPFGNRCNCRGCDASIVLDYVRRNIEEYIPRLMEQRDMGENDSVERLNRKISGLHTEIDKLKEGIGRIKSLFIDGMIDKEEMNGKHEEQTSKIEEKQRELREAEKELAYASSESVDDKIERLEIAKREYDLTDPFSSETNEYLKEIIDCIYYDRVDDEISLKIEFM